MRHKSNSDACTPLSGRFTCGLKSLIMRALLCALYLSSLSLGASKAYANKPTLRLCTGSPSGHYYGVGKIIAQAISRDISVEMLSTQGSWENLGLIHGIYNSPRRCDAIIAQDDAVAVYLYEHQESIGAIEAISPLYQEYIQIVCNRQVKAERLNELTPDTRMLVGGQGTGTFITWTLVKRLVPKIYSMLSTQKLGGAKGLDRLVSVDQPQCLLFVQALAQGLLTSINDDARLSEQLHFLHIDDRAFQYPINQGGIARVLYRANHVHRNVYPKVLQDHLRTQTVDAVLYLHRDWSAANPQLARSIRELTVSMRSRIQRYVH